MLAPLKNRALLERDDGDPQQDLPPLDGHHAAPRENARLASDNVALRQALRHARQAQKRSATLAARKIIELSNEINRLSEQNAQLRNRLTEHESGLAIVSLGQRLMVLQQANDELAAAAQRVWFLDKTLRAAHQECARLAAERDSAISGFDAMARDPLH